MDKCTSATGHHPDNQGYCHSCGISMADADKEFTRNELLSTMSDLVMVINLLPSEVRVKHGLYSIHCVDKAKKMIDAG